MKILVIEDDAHKARQLAEFVKVEAEVTPAESRSYQSGLRAVLADSPDIVLLDMSLPTYDVSRVETGGRSRPYAGREILTELKRKGIATKVVVVTQFESFGEGSEAMTLTELKRELGGEFATNYVGTVFYQPSESSWRQELRSLLARCGVPLKERP